MLLGTTVYLVSVLILHLAIQKSAAFGVIQFALVSPLVVGLIPLFAYAVDADVAGRDSTFPARMFTLPLTSHALVGWPMLYGTVSIALAWTAAAGLVIRPAGMDVPLWWPAVLLAGCLAWFQAMVWRPFGLPGLRIVAAVVPISVLVALSGLRWMIHVPEPIVALLLVCMIPPAYTVAVTGVSRARRGDQPEGQWLTALAREFAGRLSRPGRLLSSPLRAQVWFEWRRFGLGSPMTAAMMILFVSVWIAINRYNADLSHFHPLRSPVLLLAVPLVATVSLGSMWGKYEDARGGPSIPAFLATRPMTCAGLILAKMKAAADSAILLWAMTVVAFALMVLLTGSWTELASQWNGLTKDFSAVQKVIMVTLGSALLLAGTWKMMIANLYLGLAGRTWIWTVGMAVIGPGVLVVVPLCHWLLKHPEYHTDLLTAVPWVLGSAAMLKLLAGGCLVRAVVRRNLVQMRLMTGLLAAWLLTAAGLTGLFCWMVPDGLAPWYLVTSGVVLAMPLVRISLAPLALAWNRHR